MADNVIAFPPNRTSTTAARLERLEARRNIADGIRDRMGAKGKLDRSDPPILARNLGKMVERFFPGREAEAVRELLDAIKGNAALENVLSKRKRLIRLKDDPLPPMQSSQDYDAFPDRYLDIAEAIALRAPKGRSSSDEMRRQCLLLLIEGSSFDAAANHGIRRDERGASEFVLVMDRLLERLTRNGKLERYFDAFEDHRLSVAWSKDTPSWFVIEKDDLDSRGIPFVTDMYESDDLSSLEYFNFAPGIDLGQICMPFGPTQPTIRFKLPKEFTRSEDIADDRAAVRAAFLAHHGEDAEVILREVDERPYPEDEVHRARVASMDAAWERCVTRNQHHFERPIFLPKTLLMCVVRDRTTNAPKLAFEIREANDDEYDPPIWCDRWEEIDGDERPREFVDLSDTGFGNSTAYLIDQFGEVQIFRDKTPPSDFAKMHFPHEVMFVTGGGLNLALRPSSLSLGGSDNVVNFSLKFEDYRSRIVPAPPNTLAAAILRNLAFSPEGLSIADKLEEACAAEIAKMDALFAKEEADYRDGIRRLTE